MNSILLLTACVNPNGMHKTVLQDVEQRKEQYIVTIEYYLKETPLKIVVVENTLTDFRSKFQSYINSGRLEYLTFDGNNFNKNLGKGYGEMLILDYALKNSTFIRDTKYIIKISGRLKVSNISKVLKNMHHIWNHPKLFVACDISLFFTFAISRFFIAPKVFFTDYFLPNINEVNDSKKQYFEHLLGKMVLKWRLDGHKHHVFSIPIILNGVSGTTGENIRKPLKIQRYSKALKSFFFNNLLPI